MRTNLVVAFLTALCLAVVGASADLVAQKKWGGKSSRLKTCCDPIHFVFGDAGSDNIQSTPRQNLLIIDRVYRDQVDGGDAVIAGAGSFRWRPSANLNGKDAKNAEDISHKMFF